MSKLLPASFGAHIDLVNQCRVNLLSNMVTVDPRVDRVKTRQRNRGPLTRIEFRVPASKKREKVLRIRWCCSAYACRRWTRPWCRWRWSDSSVPQRDLRQLEKKAYVEVTPLSRAVNGHNLTPWVSSCNVYRQACRNISSCFWLFVFTALSCYRCLRRKWDITETVSVSFILSVAPNAAGWRFIFFILVLDNFVLISRKLI